jgi:ankyrin repeat protein
MKNPVSQVRLDGLLIRESQKGHTEKIKLLLEAGADVHAYNDLALCWARENGHTDTMEVLRAASKSAVSDIRKSFREIGIELTQPPPVKVAELVVSLAEYGRPAPPASAGPHP